MKQIVQPKRFRKDLDRAKKQKRPLKKYVLAVRKLVEGESLETRFQDHAVKGNWTGFRECHLEPDWLLIYQVTETEVILRRLGSHSELFCPIPVHKTSTLTFPNPKLVSLPRCVISATFSTGKS